MISCEVSPFKDKGNLALDDFIRLKNSEYTLNVQDIRQELCKKFAGEGELNKFLNNYYESGQPLVWIGREGLNPKIDTLLSAISQVDSIGFDQECFNLSQIRKDIKRLNTLDVDQENSLEELVARLEGNLSKAFLRYTSGQRFGYVNPSNVFNYRISHDGDKTKKVYEHKCELEVIRPDSTFFLSAMQQVNEGDIAGFIAESQPTDPLYQDLQRRLNKISKGDTLARMKYMANMERLRWKLKDDPAQHQKYVLVNIPSFRLWGIGGDTVLTMKVVCGAVKTKSPLLSSKLKRIDLNPQWHVPHSISTRSLANAGPGYFRRHNMYFVDRSGKRLSYASPAMRRKGLVSIVQSGGNHNSLGRIIFRFDNPFAVYLHHTNTPWAFTAANRAMSHGCIRLERPLDLANFLIDDSQMQEKIAYSFSCDLSHPDSTKFIRQIPLKSQIPVYLVYYTIFSVPGSNEIVELNDIYGYDKLLVRSLSPYMNANMRHLLDEGDHAAKKDKAESKDNKKNKTTKKEKTDQKEKVEKKENTEKAQDSKDRSNSLKSTTSKQGSPSHSSDDGRHKSEKNNAPVERDGNSQTSI